jgi:hypothetical protein
MKADPMGERRNAFHVFLFGVAALNGFMLALGIPTSSAIDAQLQSFGLRVYGVILLLGAGLVLLGMYWPKEARDGLLIKRVGYVALSVVTFIYSAAVAITQPGPGGFLAGSITFVFSCICLYTVHRINKRVNAVIRATARDRNGHG